VRRTIHGYSIRGSPKEKGAINSTGAWIVGIPWVLSDAKVIRRNMLQARIYRFDMWICSCTDEREFDVRSKGSYQFSKWDTFSHVAGKNDIMYDTLIRFALGGKSQKWIIEARAFHSGTGTITERFAMKSVNI
jgi:hypothetical protein